MAEPKTGALTAREAVGNASRGIRHRLADFLRNDAVRLVRAGGGARLVLAAGAAGGVLMIVSEFLLIRYVTTVTASCSDLASPAVRDSCQTTGHAHHYWGIAILGLFTLLMAFGAAVGRSRPAAWALLAAGLVCVGIALIHDLPDTSSKGQVGANFANARAHIGAGFWLELIGGLLAVGAGAFALTRLPAVAPAEGEVEEAEAGEEPPEEPEAVPPEEPERQEANEAAEEPTEKAPEATPEAPEEEPAAEEPKRKPGRRKGAARKRTGTKRSGATGTAPTGEPSEVAADEGSEGEAVEQPGDEAVPAAEQSAEAPPAEPGADSWDVEPDTPAARRSAERRAKRRERAEAARRRQKRPPRERTGKKKPPGDQGGE